MTSWGRRGGGGRRDGGTDPYVSKMFGDKTKNDQKKFGDNRAIIRRNLVIPERIIGG